MSQERFGDAVILLQRLLAFAEAEKWLHSMVEILNLLAITAAQTGDNARAFELLEKSLAIGLREGYFRNFVDEFAPMGALLDQYLLSVKKRKKPADGHCWQRFAIVLLRLSLCRRKRPRYGRRSNVSVRFQFIRTGNQSTVKIPKSGKSWLTSSIIRDMRWVGRKLWRRFGRTALMKKPITIFMCNVSIAKIFKRSRASGDFRL